MSARRKRNADKENHYDVNNDQNISNMEQEPIFFSQNANTYENKYLLRFGE